MYFTTTTPIVTIPLGRCLQTLQRGVGVFLKVHL